MHAIAWGRCMASLYDLLCAALLWYKPTYKPLVRSHCLALAPCDLAGLAGAAAPAPCQHTPLHKHAPLKLTADPPRLAAGTKPNVCGTQTPCPLGASLWAHQLPGGKTGAREAPRLPSLLACCSLLLLCCCRWPAPNCA
jgi:hypothetical protein